MGDLEREFEVPPIVHSHGAYFFIPLPDAIALPKSFTQEFIELASSEELMAGVKPAAFIAASLRFHESTTKIGDDVSRLFQLAVECLPDRNRDANSGDSRLMAGPDVEVPVTVAEVMIPLDMLDDRKVQDASGEELDSIAEAFDRGLEYVRRFQRAYYIAKRSPIRLATQESMPFMIPMGIRRFFADDGEPLPFRVEVSAYLINSNVPPNSYVEWEDGDLQSLKTALDHLADDGPFWSHLDYMREALVAFRRDGAHRSAVLFTATACEVMFDDLLAHLMWEEGERPEIAAATFDRLDSISKRVKTEFHARLGGTWSLDVEGPVNCWAEDIARLRNRCVHAGYEPTGSEAWRAIESANSLLEFLGDRVAENVGKYLRTAQLLPGRYGLERRGKWSRRIERLVRDNPGPYDGSTFSRWRRAMERVRSSDLPLEEPRLEGTNILMTRNVDGVERWIIHDQVSGMAATVDESTVLGVSAAQQERLEDLRAYMRKNPPPEPQSVLMVGARVPETAVVEWLPEYRLVPMRGVMVHGADIEWP